MQGPATGRSGQLVTRTDGALDTLDGLAVALTEQAAKAALPVSVHAAGIGRYPQEVEAAVYFSVLEALQNVARCARATSAQVRLSHDGARLRFEVADDGIGFDPDTTTPGTGLQGITDLARHRRRHDDPRIHPRGGHHDHRRGPRWSQTWQ